MYDLFYNMFASENFFGATAMSIESTQVLCHYLAIGFTIGVFMLVIMGLLKLVKIIVNL